MENLKVVKRDLQKSLYAGKFSTVPGDVFTVKATPGMLSSSITVHITNTGDLNDAAIVTNEYLSLPNNLDAWKLLKQLSEMGGRTVLHQRGEEKPVNYKDSEPYRYRFKGGK